MEIVNELPKDAQKAIVILMKTKNDNTRYFNDFRKGRFVCAWSLAGARLFLPDNPELKIIEDALEESGYLFERREIGLNL